MSPRLKIVLDYGPLAIFGIAYVAFGLFPATAAIMVAVSIAMVVEFAIQRRVSPMLLFTGVMVLGFGSLTLWLSNAIFIKIKVTAYYVIFAAALAIGLFFDRLFIKMLLAQTLRMPDSAWRMLTWRFVFFFFGLAVANEVIWRNFSTNIWVAFKFFGTIPLTMLFMLAQTPFIMRHQLEIDETPPSV